MPSGGSVVWVLLASAFLYCGGMALNDACDTAKDGVERPGRPVPSGRVSRTEAFAISIGLMIAGILAAGFASPRCVFVSLLLCTAIVSYDALLKNTALAPALMGGCRALNIALGYAASGVEWTAAPSAPFACMWLYAAGVTLFAQNEARTNARLRLFMGAIAVAMASAGVAATTSYRNRSLGASVDLLPLVAPALALSAWHAYLGFRAVRSPSPEMVQRCAGRFVLAIILLDASMLWSMRRPWEAIVVTACLFPAASLSRLFRVT